MKDPLYFPIKQFSARFGKQFFTYELEDVSVEHDSSCCDQQHAVYRIHMKQGKNEWDVKHRFREFVQLHNHIQSLRPSDASIPKPPPKTWFQSLDSAFLDDRKTKLSDFLHELFLHLSQQKIHYDQYILQFFGIDPNFE